MPTFWIICCWRAETGELLQRLLLQRTNEDFQASRWHKTDRIFYCCRGFFLVVCLMGWDTQVWFVCIRSCSEESQVRMSMNLDRELRFGFLGFVFIFFLLFLFFFVGKRLDLLYKGQRIVFFIFGWTDASCDFFKRMALYVSVFEGGIFANVSTPG